MLILITTFFYTMVKRYICTCTYLVFIIADITEMCRFYFTVGFLKLLLYNCFEIHVSFKIKMISMTYCPCAFAEA